MISMKAPEAACSAVVGSTQYNVRNGRVEVAPEHVKHLLPQGFLLLDGQNYEQLLRQSPEEAIAKANAAYPLITMRAPEGARSATIEGVLYTVDADGLVTVPSSAAPHLKPSGFEVVEALAPAPVVEPALRDDGPTLEEFVEAGYRAENYPPSGYAAKASAPAAPASAPPPEEGDDAPVAPDGAPIESMNVFQLLKVLRDRGGDTSKPNDKVTLLNRIAALPPVDAA